MSTTALPLDPALLKTEAIESVLLARDLRLYMRGTESPPRPGAWPIVEKDRLVWGWHLDCLTEHLQAVSAGQIENLLINIPPGFSKSVTVSVMWPTWEWTSRPEGRWFFASYDQELSTRDSLKCRNIASSPWYQARWARVWRFSGDQNRKTLFENDKRGWRLATSIGGHGLGEHPDRIVVDDPHNREKITSEAERKAVIDWWTQTIITRGAARGVRKVVIMQRLHEEDLSAHILREEGSSWVHICLPMRYEPGRMVATPLDFQDPRATTGELLDPVRYPEALVAKMETTMGPYTVAGQFQQRPSPAGGGLIKREWLRFWVPTPRMPARPGDEERDWPPVRDDEGREYLLVQLPEQLDQEILSIDASFKGEADAVRGGRLPDPVSAGALGRKGADVFLLDRVNRRMDVVETCEALLLLSKRYPRAVAKVIEDKANGPAIVALLSRNLGGLIPVTPYGSKTSRVLNPTASPTSRDRDARAMSMQAIFAAGNFWVPHPAIAPWVWDYIEELCAFPNHPTDDDVDMTSQALTFLQPWVWREADADHHLAVRMGGVPPRSTEEIQRNLRREQLERERRPLRTRRHIHRRPR